MLKRIMTAIQRQCGIIDESIYIYKEGGKCPLVTRKDPIQSLTTKN